MVAASPPLPSGSRPRPPKHGTLMKPRFYSVDDQVRSAYFTPAPGEYNPKKFPDVAEPKSLGKISNAKIPSGHQYYAKTKAYIPGPGAYLTPDLKDFALPEGGRLNRKPPEKKAEFNEYPQPAPGDYGIPNDPTAPRLVNGRFGKDVRVTKFIQDEVRRSRGVPAPGQHRVQESMEAIKPFCPEGGKVLHMSKGLSYFEQAPRRWEGLPAPDRYELPGSINPDKTVGKATFKYESATINETKAMVTKVVGDAPGPGHYKLPDPEPINRAVAFGRKELGHGMPHPFQYNCAPDLAGKYTALVPVRQQNSGDQIYGNGVRRGAAPKFTGAAMRSSRPSSSGSTSQAMEMSDMRLHESFYPDGTTEMDKNPEDVVQWRPGGFEPLKKSRSSPSVVQTQQHLQRQDLEEVKKTYPGLCFRGKPKPSDVSTQETSNEYVKIRRGQVQLKAVSDGIHAVTSSLLEPLDLDKLKREAQETLIDKARNRLDAQGVAREKQELVIAEMLGVMNETAGIPHPTGASAEPGTGQMEPL
eukprot:TRINITY_DN82277_c0_g1_i1.p1 TRINITY_DN82277_c0_g1~~TRINITY_DN82277_c0_g1_i1.p1  ORF type:complete len:527 (-),score=137.91 TRINITY_DN82277_c0_g1_i1:110-1690(-)